MFHWACCQRALWIITLREWFAAAGAASRLRCRDRRLAVPAFLDRRRHCGRCCVDLGCVTVRRRISVVKESRIDPGNQLPYIYSYSTALGCSNTCSTANHTHACPNRRTAVLRGYIQSERKFTNVGDPVHLFCILLLEKDHVSSVTLAGLATGLERCLMRGWVLSYACPLAHPPSSEGIDALGSVMHFGILHKPISICRSSKLFVSSSSE